MKISDFANRRTDFGKAEAPNKLGLRLARIRVGDEVWRVELFDREHETPELVRELELAAEDFGTMLWALGQLVR